MMEMLAAIALLGAGAIAVEVSLRVMGFGSFPLFELAGPGVYRTRPNQAGRFRRRHAWCYDTNGMRNESVPPSFAESTLLIGDSIVDGGLGLGQSQTLAVLAARLSGDSFYTVGCPGWALGNCLPAIRSLLGWSAAKRLVFVLNTGDLDTVNIPETELSFPTRHPIWLTQWFARRQAWRRLGGYLGERNETKAPSEETRASNAAQFRELLAEYPGPVLLIRYPKRGENARTEGYFERLASLDSRVRILEVAEAADWSEECYADHIHPNARGLEVLARFLCQELG